MKRLLFFLAYVVMLAVLPTAMEAQIHFTAVLDGTQQVPPVATPATGTGSFVMSDDFTEVRYFISYQGMSMTGVDGHFHIGSPGENGTIAKEIVTPSSTSGTFAGVWKSTDASEPLTPAIVDSFLTGRMFINLHDPANPGGEIRGQILLATSLHFEVNYEGTQEVPPVSSPAGGTGVFVLNKTRTQIDYWVTYRGLSGTLTAGGHVHTGAVGVNGGIVRNLASTGDPASGSVHGSWKSSDASQPLTAALVDSLISGRMYSNFHTSAHPGGEIRGQLVLKGGIGFVASLDGAHENPATGSSATGTGSFILNSSRTELAYKLTYIGLSSPLTAGGHIHVGSVGRNGSIVRNLAASGDSAQGTLSGVWRSTDLSQQMTTALVESLFTGKLYSNFHTTTSPGGEIRGQLNLTTGVGFTTQLAAKNENPPTTSTGAGTASVVLNPDRQSLSYEITYFDLTGSLSGAGGNFYTGARGVNGTIVKEIAIGGWPSAMSLSGTWSATDITQQLTSGLVDSLIAGKIYANFITAANPDGEVRGQVAFAIDVPTSVRDISLAVPAEFRLEQNYPNPFNPTTAIRFQVAATTRVSLNVYNLLGQKIASLVDEMKAPGVYEVKFDASRIASGVYFYRVSMGSGGTITRKMTVLK